MIEKCSLYPRGGGWEYLDDWTIYRSVSTPGEGGGVPG